MTDIVEKLRAPAYWMSGSSEGHEGENSAPREAADEITRLRAENEKLRAALEEIAGISVSSWIGDIHGDAQDEWRDKLDAAISVARAALPREVK